ncbi:helix-turn-helix transcriptional regulator [Natronosalvus vescus]|uniref:helix-turn-helix transcriptional regulator n=1 Tax=Natronosalvus vescus TaxID=2953881 RepID=UPI002090C42F|nr:helix-turn-helix domain-containing protein [Natronosalvus vescus]
MSDRPNTDGSREFVSTVMSRAELLERLEESQTVRELADELSMARSTVHRVTESLEEHDLVEKPNEHIEHTGLGTVVAAELQTLRTKLEAAQRLEPFLNTLNGEVTDIPLERFTDVTVTQSQHRQAHVGAKRITDLIERTDSLRMFSSIISPLYVDVALREMLNGTEIDVIFDQEIIGVVAEQYYDQAQEALETGRFGLHMTDDVPFELFLFDDRMGMAAHDDDGIARAFVESTDPAAREWAESLYAEYASEAETVTFG